MDRKSGIAPFLLVAFIAVVLSFLIPAAEPAGSSPPTAVLSGPPQESAPTAPSAAQAGEAPPAGPAGEPEGTGQAAPFRVDVEVRVLNLRVVVTDEKGNFVRDLTPADFRLAVGGLEVPLSNFYEVREGKALLPEAPAAAAGSGGPAGDAPGAASAAGGSGESSPQAAIEPGKAGASAAPPADPDPSIRYIFFFDNLHMDPANRPRVLSRLNDFVDRSFQAGDQGLVVHFEQGFKLETRFTENPAVLKDELRRASMQSAFPGGLAAEGPTGVYSGPFQELADRGREEKSYYARLSAEALGTLGSFLNGVSGRRALVYVADGLPVEMGSGLQFESKRNDPVYSGSAGEKEALFDAVERLNEGSVPVFTLDARGLSGETTWLSPESNGVRYLARETGGRDFTGSGAFTEALSGIRAMMDNYYSLGIRTDSWESDRYHLLAVDLPGRRGLRLSFQRGFEVASPDTRMARETLLLHFDRRLGRNPLEATALVEGVERTVQGGKEAVRLTLAISLPQRRLGLVERSAGVLSGELAFFIAARAEELSMIPSRVIRHPVSIPAAERDPEGMYTYRARLVFPAGSYRMAVGVRDGLTGESSLLLASRAPEPAGPGVPAAPAGAEPVSPPGGAGTQPSGGEQGASSGQGAAVQGPPGGAGMEESPEASPPPGEGQ